jgi:DNA-binding GntR family transcriptional regulator
MGRSSVRRLSVVDDRPLRDAVADAVRSAILSGELPPGTRVPEEQLALDRGVSRVPVREALLRLAGEGFVVLSPGRGATVAAPAVEKTLELMEIRRSLELLGVRRAAQARGGQQAAELTRVVRLGTRALAAGQHHKLPPMVDRFHELLTAASGNQELVAMLANLRLRVGWMFSVDVETRSVTAWQEHAAILAAVLGGDPDLAATLTDTHVRHDEGLLRAMATDQAPAS